jgi:hypothetical protein
MAQLIYTAIASLDGYIEDEHGKFDWAAPSTEVHAFINDLERRVGTYLYGRRMYETMVPWETMDDPAAVMRDYTQIWRAADKVVYSRTLAEPSSASTRIEREFDPEAVRQLKATLEREPQRGRTRAGRRGASRGVGRRDRAVPQPGRGRRREAGSARRRSRAARAARAAALRERRRVRPLQHEGRPVGRPSQGCWT